MVDREENNEEGERGREKETPLVFYRSTKVKTDSHDLRVTNLSESRFLVAPKRFQKFRQRISSSREIRFLGFDRASLVGAIQNYPTWIRNVKVSLFEKKKQKKKKEKKKRFKENLQKIGSRDEVE